MKQLYKNAQVPVPRGKILESENQAIAFVKEVGFPLIAKPDIGVGAADTFKLNNEKELKEFFSVRREKDFMFEEFVVGQIESFDGLVDREGNIVFYTSHVFCSGIMEVVTQNTELYYHSVREVPQELKEMGFRIVKLSGLKEKFFHFEFFRTKEKGLIALEMNLRPPGAYTLDMFNFANNIDVYREWASILVNGTFGASDYSRPYFCCQFGRKDRFTYTHSHQEIIEQWGKDIVLHAHMPSIFQTVMGSYFYIFRTTSFEEMKLIIEFIQKKVSAS